MSLFNLSSFFFPVKAATENIKPVVGGTVIPKTTTISNIQWYTGLGNITIPNDTPLHIVHSAGGNHIITSDGHLVNLENIMLLDYKAKTKKKGGLFSSPTHTYVPCVITKDCCESLQIHNIEFTNLSEINEFLAHVRHNVNLCKNYKNI